MLRDREDRRVTYLRLSLTSACHMRCVYCRPELHDNHPPGLLSPAEIGALVSHLGRRHGVRKVRLTGGDPTFRGDLTEILERIAAVPEVQDLAMTTNGMLLPSRALDWRRAGLNRVNISLDSLDPLRFARMTGVPGLERVVRGIESALAAGFERVRLNTVVLRHENLEELPNLLSFAADLGVEIRFIELMPMGPLATAWKDGYVPAVRMKLELSELVVRWSPLPRGPESAARFDVVLVDGRRATVGFITPMSCAFCADCDRLRITADGVLYPCLMDHPSGSILPALRPAFDPERLDSLLLEGLRRKAPEHPPEGFAVMTNIGG